MLYCTPFLMWYDKERVVGSLGASSHNNVLAVEPAPHELCCTVSDWAMEMQRKGLMHPLFTRIGQRSFHEERFNFYVSGSPRAWAEADPDALSYLISDEREVRLAPPSVRLALRRLVDRGNEIVGSTLGPLLTELVVQGPNTSSQDWHVDQKAQAGVPSNVNLTSSLSGGPPTEMVLTPCKSRQPTVPVGTWQMFYAVGDVHRGPENPFGSKWRVVLFLTYGGVTTDYPIPVSVE